MEHEHGILLGSGRDSTDEKFAQTIRKNYSYKADWLEYYVLKNTSLLPELTNTEKCQYKPLGEESLAILRLIQEVCAFCRWNNAENLCINRWWLACEWELCIDQLSKSGYTGKAVVLGGKEAYKKAIEAEYLLDSKEIQTSTVEIRQLTPMQALEGFAYFLSQGDGIDKLTFKTHFEVYKKSKKSCLRRLAISKMNPAYIIDGQYVLMSQGKPKQKRIMK